MLLVVRLRLGLVGEGGTVATDLLDDVVGGGLPYEWFGSSFQ
jgi:hypothetical protein